MWTAWAFPLVVLAIVVATGPVIYMTYHSIRFGHHPSPANGGRDASISHGATAPEPADPEQFGWTVCPDCRAVVVDPVEHIHAVHLREYTPA